MRLRFYKATSKSEPCPQAATATGARKLPTTSTRICRCSLIPSQVDGLVHLPLYRAGHSSNVIISPGALIGFARSRCRNAQALFRAETPSLPSRLIMDIPLIMFGLKLQKKQNSWEGQRIKGLSTLPSFRVLSAHVASIRDMSE